MGAHCHLPSPHFPRDVASLRVKASRGWGMGVSWAQRKVAGVLSPKRGAPRSVAARTVREDNRTPPAPGTLVLTLVSPPLPVLPSPSSRAGVRRRGRGPAVKKGHLTASPQLGHSSPGGPPKLL